MPVLTDKSVDKSALKRELLTIERREMNLLSRKHKLQQSFGLAFYNPHAKQRAFHEAGDFQQRLAEAGNRGGKSTCGVAEDCAWLLGYRPWYDEGDPRRTLGIPPPPNKGIVLAADWEKVSEVFTNEAADQPGKIWTMLPQGFVTKKTRNHTGGIGRVECENGSVLAFDTTRSFMSNPLGQESSDWDFLHVDEPCSKEQYVAITRGLIDRAGKVWFTLTPIMEPWIGEMFFPDSVSVKDRPNTNSIKRDGKKKYFAIRWSMYDNPHLTRDAIEDFESNLTEEEKMARIHGYPLALSGTIYKEYEAERHVLREIPEGWESFERPPLDYNIWWRLDPHPAKAHAVLFMAISPLGQLFIYDEIFDPGTISHVCEMIKAKTAGYFVPSKKADPAAWNPDPVTRQTEIVNSVYRSGIYGLSKASKDLSNGINKVRQDLKADGRIYFSPNLVRTAWEIRRYRWNPKTGKPVDTEDHMMENLYRLLIDDPIYIDPSEAEAPNLAEEPQFNNSELYEEIY